MNIQLSDHFTYAKLARFTIPSIGMMLFTSIYGIVDGIFVSNFVGKTAFAAVNLIMPFLMIFGALGFMIGTGGTALISKTMGEGKQDKANELFTMLIAISALLAAVLTVLGTVFMRPVAIFLGAEGQMVEDCVVYGRLLMSTLVFFILQNEFQSFCVAAERPRLGLVITVAAGVTNILLDALFVGLFRWGLIGAGAATAISQLVGGVVPLVYFALPNPSPLGLRRFSFDGRALWRSCTNGSSELLAPTLSGIFVSYDPVLYAMTCRGFRLYSLSFLCMGFNMFGSSFFTALNNGPVSALISFLRAFLFQVGAILALPVFLGLDGIWLSVVAAELLALAVTVGCFVKFQKKYRY